MSELVQLIATYGVLPVLIAALIGMWIYTVKSQHNFNKKQQEINEKQQAANDAQETRLMETFEKVSGIMTEIRYNTAVIHSKEEEDENRRVDEVIYQQLYELLDKFRANRVSCFAYHNGGRNVLGRSFQKMSMSHEVVDGNTAPQMTQYQQMPRMLFPILNQKMAEQGYYYIEDLNMIREIDATTYQSFIARGVKAAFVQAIKATSGTLLGFMTVEFTDGPKECSKELKHNLLGKTAKISGILEVSRETVLEAKEE